MVPSAVRVSCIVVVTSTVIWFVSTEMGVAAEKFFSKKIEIATRKANLISFNVSLLNLVAIV